MNVLDIRFGQSFLEVVLIELGSVLRARKRPNVCDALYSECPENFLGIFPGAIREADRVDVEWHQ